MRYRVHMTNTITSSVEVEADGPEAAIEAAYQSDDMPGGITVGAFGSSASVDDGEWQPAEVTDDKYEVVWTESVGEVRPVEPDVTA